MENYSYIGVLTSDDYLPGALVLYHNLKILNSKYPFYLICADTLSKETYLILDKNKISYTIEKFEPFVLSNNHPSLHWKNTSLKLNIFNLQQFDKCIYLDLDTLIVQNIDFLFELNTKNTVYFSTIFLKDSCGTIADLPLPIKFISAVMIFSPDLNLLPIFNSYLDQKEGGDELIILSGLFFGSKDKFVTALPSIFCANPTTTQLNFEYIFHFSTVNKPWNFTEEEWRAIHPTIRLLYKKLLNCINI